MTVVADRTALLEPLQRALRTSHRNGIRNLTLTPRDGGVDLDGEASSYYAVQLVIRDVLAADVRIRYNRIRVCPSSRR